MNTKTLHSIVVSSLLFVPVTSAVASDVVHQHTKPRLTLIAESNQVWKQHFNSLSPAARAAIPALPSGDGCTLVPNPDFVPSAEAVAAANASLKSGLETGLASMTPEARSIANVRALSAGLKSDLQKSEAQIIRKDANGNIILRVLFWYGPSLDGADKAALERDARANLVQSSATFQRSGLKTIFEFAGLERYSGIWYETTDVNDPSLSVPGRPMTSLLSNLSQPNLRFDINTSSFVPNPNYPISVASLARNQANVAVILFGNPPVEAVGMANVGGILNPSMDTYSPGGNVFVPLSVMLTSYTTINEDTGTGSVITHEIGHLIGQKHGPDSDGFIGNQMEMDYRTRGYRPYANGWRAAPVADLTTIMALSTPDTKSEWATFSSPLIKDNTGRPVGNAKADNVKALNYDIEGFTVGTTPGVTSWAVPLVEFYCSKLGQYFTTARQSNIDILDQLGEAATCWARTGETYNATSAWGTSNENLQPVLRFYGSSNAGPNTHFYTIGPRLAYAKNTRGEDVSLGQAYAEGNIDFAGSGDINTLLYLAARNVMETDDTQPGLHFESVDFRAVPTEYNGLATKNCSYAGKNYKPVYRLYNGQDGSRLRPDGTRIDGNHRYTIKQSVVDDMTSKGWLYEGVAWCAQ